MDEKRERPETYADLVKEFRQVLGEMEVWLQFGSTTNFSSDGGGGAFVGGERPPGDEYPPAERWRDEWERRGDRLVVWEEAVDDFESMRKQKVVEIKPESQQELQARILTKVGWSPQEIANHSEFKVNTTAKIVRDTRIAASVSPETGRSLPSGRNAHERVRRLKSEFGLTERQIATITNIPKTTVRRALGKSA